MDATTPGDRRVWGVRCGDGEVLWVDDEAAAYRLLASLVGAEQIVHRPDPGQDDAGTVDAAHHGNDRPALG